MRLMAMPWLVVEMLFTMQFAVVFIPSRSPRLAQPSARIKGIRAELGAEEVLVEPGRRCNGHHRSDAVPPEAPTSTERKRGTVR